MKFLVDNQFSLRTVDEVNTFVSTRMTPTKSIKIILTEKDQPIESALISPKILKLMKLTKDHCNVAEVIVDFKFEGIEEDTFSLVLKTEQKEEKVEKIEKESLIAKLNPFKKNSL